MKIANSWPILGSFPILLCGKKMHNNHIFIASPIKFFEFWACCNLLFDPIVHDIIATFDCYLFLSLYMLLLLCLIVIYFTHYVCYYCYFYLLLISLIAHAIMATFGCYLLLSLCMLLLLLLIVIYFSHCACCCCCFWLFFYFTFYLIMWSLSLIDIFFVNHLRNVYKSVI